MQRRSLYKFYRNRVRLYAASMASAALNDAASRTIGANRVVVITGPTGVGKSSLGMRLCEQLDGEIITADSVQVFRNLNIGCNKASQADRERVPHHLLDLRESDQQYTAGEFYKDALAAIQDVLSRGKLPVLEGGTSMYIHWLVNGRPSAPEADPKVAETIRQQLAPLKLAGDWEGGLALLQQVDPESVAELVKNDWYRLHRMLTIATQTGQIRSSIDAKPDNDGLDELRESLDMRCFFLHADREKLCRRIDDRCDWILERGLLEETCEQMIKAKLIPATPVGRSIGYNQAMSFLLRRKWRWEDGKSLAKFIREFKAVSRQYARKQAKQFRKEAGFEWVPTDIDLPEEAFQRILTHVLCDREKYDEIISSAEQAQLQAPRQNDEDMKKYKPPSVDEELFASLLETADRCREELQPMLAEILDDNAAIKERFPYGDRPITRRR